MFSPDLGNYLAFSSITTGLTSSFLPFLSSFLTGAFGLFFYSASFFSSSNICFFVSLG
jgi:hypothetical protein